ncbi:nucleotide-binding universal stress UspA family protein [Saccharopolyspora gloriosae]|uniref:Nucleotide-binding universal stress UspA family protein n=1 Tax=Saccharopolyspora gloriosae TaxID=455344 RepID=A0A840NE11_9PSEU|nr:universal stress protein [Saccharopolyspora gloriosae]MBB5070160.1 nucleotide-binding universal stress UspA family protein [Saccharopolyspora gloriosae]
MPIGRRGCAVAVDGTPESERAVEWVCANAELCGDELVLSTVVADPLPADAHPDWLVDLAARTRQRLGVPVRDEVLIGRPVPRLLEVAGRAPLLVLGSRGHRAFHDAVLGSVALGVATRSPNPAVVVRGAAEQVRHETVVAGVDGSAGGNRALEFACEAAEALRCDVLAVQASPDAAFIPGPYGQPDRTELVDRAELVLAESVAGFAPRHPDVTLRRLTSSMDPITTLAEAATGARLLVVGRRGSGGFTEMLLGSVSRGVLHHATCPVAVVPPGGEPSRGAR